MIDMSLESQLTQLGLNEKESKIYLAALELGPSQISAIAKKAEINRITTYDNIDLLKAKGLISTLQKGKKRLYLAAEPQTLAQLIESKNKILNNLMPHLQGLSNINRKKPIIQYFEGEEGMINLYTKTLDAKNELLCFGNEKHFYDLVLKKYLPDYRLKRKEKAIKAKIIIPDTKRGRDTKKTDKQGFRETKLVDPKKYALNVYFLLYNDSTIIISPDDLIGLFIESKDITNTLKSFHRMLWDTYQ
jgi:HTH-type transcriptional regulator, sugar sensing transcriptional regulator